MSIKKDVRVPMTQYDIAALAFANLENAVQTHVEAYEVWAALNALRDALRDLDIVPIDSEEN